MTPLARRELFDHLEHLYSRFTRREFAGNDPVCILYRYREPEDREIAGLIAASLAYGQVSQIVRSAEAALASMGDSPRRFLEVKAPGEIRRVFSGFRHRWTGGADLAALLLGVRKVIRKRGTLRAAFLGAYRPGDETFQHALTVWVGELGSPGPCERLLSPPGRGSACKRLWMYLRWMVRKDEVDVGDWNDAPPDKLLVPIDVHMHRVGRQLGFTSRRQGDLRTAREVTSGFRDLCPDDPVRYDFALTRPGILKFGEPLPPHVPGGIGP